MPEFGAAAGPVAVIDTEAWRVRLVSPLDGSIERIIRRETAPRAATDAVYAAHIEGIVGMVASAGAPAEQVEFVERMWREYPRAATLPVLRSVHVDASGHLWLAPYYIAGAEPPPFEVLAPDGTWLGAVRAPAWAGAGIHPVPGPLHGDRDRLRARGVEGRAGRAVRADVPAEQVAGPRLFPSGPWKDLAPTALPLSRTTTRSADPTNTSGCEVATGRWPRGCSRKGVALVGTCQDF